MNSIIKIVFLLKKITCSLQTTNLTSNPTPIPFNNTNSVTSSHDLSSNEFPEQHRTFNYSELGPNNSIFIRGIRLQFDPTKPTLLRNSTSNNIFTIGDNSSEKVVAFEKSLKKVTENRVSLSKGRLTRNKRDVEAPTTTIRNSDIGLQENNADNSTSRPDYQNSTLNTSDEIKNATDQIIDMSESTPIFREEHLGITCFLIVYLLICVLVGDF